MLFHLATYLATFFGPARLLKSYAVLITLALYLGFFISYFFLPKLYPKLPRDRGRDFTPGSEAAKGKPTGGGAVFISIFVIIAFFFVPLTALQIAIVILTWITMLFGFLDDKSSLAWGEYQKALLDLLICLVASFILYHLNPKVLNGEALYIWLPFFTQAFAIPQWLFILLSTIILWVSINTTNCTDGVDGLSSTLALIALITMGIIFYFIIGHKDISAYLLVPHLKDGASWAILTFALSGVLMGYLWHNAFPSKVLMGDAGSRALGFYIGTSVIVSGNPFLLLATSSIILLNGGMGLLKVFLLRFFKVRLFQNIRFPLHDHMKSSRQWSSTQVLVKFMILQILITIAMLGLIFKVR